MMNKQQWRVISLCTFIESYGRKEGVLTKGHLILWIYISSHLEIFYKCSSFDTELFPLISRLLYIYHPRLIYTNIARSSNT